MVTGANYHLVPRYIDFALGGGVGYSTTENMVRLSHSKFISTSSGSYYQAPLGILGESKSPWIQKD